MAVPFDPYASGEAVPRPGRLSASVETGEYVIKLPAAGGKTHKRLLFVQEGDATRTVEVSASMTEVRCAFQPGVRVAAFLVDETKQGERSTASPVLIFWTDA